MKKVFALSLTFLMLFTITGCSKKPSLPEKGEPLVFVAKVLSIDEELDTVFVEADGQKFTKAVISLHSDTEILDSKGEKIKLTDLKKNDSITITNFGLMTEDYPVQMSAQKIVVNK